MKFFAPLFLFLFTVQHLSAQTPYFQQEVNYQIEVTLDDQAHTLTGEIEMEYTNNSPDELKLIYMHLWANAFSDRNTAFARQKVRQGKSKFYFAKEEDLGNYSSFDFTVDDQSVPFKLEKDNPDIGVLTLPKGLKSGETIKIKTPFVLKIPASFSRLGHVGESYQMTQWFPKPAVYDREGWHQMPYLDMGEFYSEFGSFEVEITLPKNYIVASTGVLQTASEKAFIKEQIVKSNRILQDSLPSTVDFPASDAEMKTIRFTAEKIHDFAWFADKRFYVQKSEVVLASGKKVDTWAYFTNAEGELWKKGTFYVDRSTKFYSEMVGEYPYPQATAVQSALSAGGGMEYPMITVIGLSGDAQSLDEVITHEVGHNWFYGILGFDERAHGWLDEGINSYYDHRYTELFYGKNSMQLPDLIMKSSDYTVPELGMLYQTRRNRDQAPSTDSDDFSLINYFLNLYEKPAVVLKYLEKYLGTKKYDQIMQGFYEKWKFKHPSPEDFRDYMVSNSGEDLNWFFDGFINSNEKFDYALKAVKKTEGDNGDYEVKVKNKGGINAPFAISGVKDSQLIATQWFPGFEGTQSLKFPSGDYDRLVLDAEKHAPDLYRHNNSIKTSGLLKRVKPLKFRMPIGIEHSKNAVVSVLPLVSWNNYDKTMLGLALFSSPLPAKRFEYILAPLYSFVSKDINGTANLQYHFYPGNNFLQQLTLDLGVKRFNYTYNFRYGYHLQYTRIVPALKLELASKENDSFKHFLQYRAVLLNEERPQFSVDSITGVSYEGNDLLGSLIHEVSYWGENKKGVNPFSYKVTLEQQSYEDAFEVTQDYLKASLELNGEYTYDRKGKSVNLRLFAGGFLSNTRRNAGNFYDNVSNRSTRGSFGLTHQGFLDDKYDEHYLGRSEDNGIFSQQIAMRDGGLKNAFGSSFDLGLSNSFIIAANLTADLPQDLPFRLPLKPYFDIGYFKNAKPTGTGATTVDQTLWSFGLSLDWFDGRLAIYLPLANSKNMRNLYGERGNYLGRITYTLDLNSVNPFELVNDISF